MGLAIFAVPAGCLAVLAVRFGGGITGLAPLGWAAAVAVVALAVMFTRPVFSRGSAAMGRMGVKMHGHGVGGRALIARHEAGHAVAAKALGGRVESAVMTDHGGLVRARIPAGPLSAVTFLLAGQIAAGTTEGAGGDNDLVRKELRAVPGSERGQVRRDAAAAASRIVSSHGGAITAYARKLNDKGRL